MDNSTSIPHTDESIITTRCRFLCFMFFAVCYLCPFPEVNAESHETKYSVNNLEKKELIENFIQSKGYESKIIFDASNIKLFWIDKTVLSKDDSINILLKDRISDKNHSVPLKIQLANVKDNQDCKVEVISDTPDFSFSVTDSKNKMLSMSSVDEPFVQYHITSCSFHIEDTQDYSFNLNFASTKQDLLSIKKIILSFSDNKKSTFLFSPGLLKITQSDVNVYTASLKENSSFIITGKQSRCTTKKMIAISPDNEVTTSVKIKNIGNKPTNIRIGFQVYTKDRVILYPNNYPNDISSKSLEVVSSNSDSNKIIVDSYYANWHKDCFVALDAKEDYSDIPNRSFVDGQIVDMKKLPNGQAEITLNKPLKTALKTGAKIRIHGRIGAYIYISRQDLQPGEEKTFTSSIQKDESFYLYSRQAFSRGVYYIRPVILSYSLNENDENTIQISDYSVSY